MAAPIDLLHLGRPRVIAVYLLAGDEPAIVDCGPGTCTDALLRGLAGHGLTLHDLRHVVLTHIHPDHCGGAGALVRQHPGLQVHVHETVAPHLVDPARLEDSARRVYGDEYDRLFGPIEPVPARNVHVLGERVLDLEVFPTPGHAPHHVSFLAPDGTCYVGDAAGILVPPARFLYPASAPPGIDVEAWNVSLDTIEGRGPESLCLAHFGEQPDPSAHLALMRERLGVWAARVRDGWTVEAFTAAAEEELQREDPETIACYRHQPGFELSYAGLRRYWDKKTDRQGGD
jgi:glyoxylase-like metal-dependent hydrolase (beta-lactamase superfamily II)